MGHTRKGGAQTRRGSWLRPFAAGVLAGLSIRALDRRNDAPPPVGATSDIGPRGWRDMLTRAAREFTADRIPATAAGVTFFVLLALFPAISAFVSLYGLLANVGTVERQTASLGGFLPGGAVSVIGDQLTRLTASGHASLGFAFIVSLAVSLWSANTGMKALIEGLDVAYEARETRGLIKLNAISLAFTLGAIALAMATAFLAVGAAPFLAGFHVFDGVEKIARWFICLVALVVLLSIIYRFGPSRPGARWRWITPGSLLAALGWMAMSGLFSWYVAHLGHYDRTYGSLGAIVGFLTWIWLSLMVVLFGAELNSEIEAVDHGA